ncbi:serine/threonine kinase [Aureococcus anophagefferens]|nr:serine/threonine kinase [Aureococcus anophagefferens]
MGGVLSLCCTQDLFKDAPDVWYASQSALEADYAFGAALGEGMFAKLCGGGDLMHHVEGQRKFTAGDAAAYFSDACAAIARCHAVSVAHRDVKPENMLVAFDGRRRARVRLSDFGSACVFAPGDRYPADAGSPFWSSPEAWALDYDHRGDVYSVGVVLLVLVDGMLGGDEVRALHGAGVKGLVDYRYAPVGISPTTAATSDAPPRPAAFEDRAATRTAQRPPGL